MLVLSKASALAFIWKLPEQLLFAGKIVIDSFLILYICDSNLNKLAISSSVMF